MNGRMVGTLAIGGTVVAAWCYLAFAPNDDPAALKTIAGCFESSETLPASFVVRQDGMATFEAERVRVSGYRDKEGVSLNPQRAVTVDRQDHNRLELESTSGLLLRYRSADQTLEIPDRHGGPSAVFRRVRCA